MSPDEFALMQAIRANPADDTPRLVFADFLEERGDEANVARAEYIRIECALERIKDDDPEHGALERRSSELSVAFADRWRQELEQRILTRYPAIRFGEPPDGDVYGMLFHRGMISTLSIGWVGLQKFPDLAPLIGPIEYLRLYHVEGPGASAGRISENWNVRKMKILEVRGKSLSFDQLLAGYGVLNVISRDEFASVPVLRLVTSNAGRAVPVAGVVGYVVNGQMNPVVLFDSADDLPMVHAVVVDPLNLWTLVEPWVELCIVSTWHFAGAELSSYQKLRAPSARLRHLVHHYKLAGLPPPADKSVPPYPLDERERPKRSILTRAARWIRGKR